MNTKLHSVHVTTATSSCAMTGVVLVLPHIWQVVLIFSPDNFARPCRLARARVKPISNRPDKFGRGFISRHHFMRPGGLNICQL
jgi:hypothetical protein